MMHKCKCKPYFVIHIKISVVGIGGQDVEACGTKVRYSIVTTLCRLHDKKCFTINDLLIIHRRKN